MNPKTIDEQLIRNFPTPTKWSRYVAHLACLTNIHNAGSYAFFHRGEDTICLSRCLHCGWWFAFQMPAHRQLFAAMENPTDTLRAWERTR